MIVKHILQFKCSNHSSVVNLEKSIQKVQKREGEREEKRRKKRKSARPELKKQNSNKNTTAKRKIKGGRESE